MSGLPLDSAAFTDRQSVVHTVARLSCKVVTLHTHGNHPLECVQAVFDDYEEGDVVWCQDYHLMLLPALLKARYPKMKVRVVTLPWSVVIVVHG